jgi:hypothetical protein
VTILYARGIAAEQTSALFQIALAEFLGFSEFAESLTDEHCGRVQAIEEQMQQT